MIVKAISFLIILASLGFAGLSTYSGILKHIDAQEAKMEALLNDY